MRIHEFGEDNKRIILLLHPAAVFWDYFSLVIPFLEEDFHVIVPAMPGYNEENPNEDYTSVEEIAAELDEWLSERGYSEIDCLFGCSMGGAVALRMLGVSRMKIRNAIIDGGITPYQYPWIVTRIIALKDFILINIGKLGGLRLLEKLFSTDEYSEEDLKYIAKVLKFMSQKMVWRTFDSCNNYEMPETVHREDTYVEYWYAKCELSDRRDDLKYVKGMLPRIKVVELDGIGHGGMAAKRPDELAGRIRKICGI